MTNATFNREVELTRELLDVLVNIEASEVSLASLKKRRLEILTSLNDGKILPTTNLDMVEEKPKTRAKKPVEPTPDITPEAQADYEKQDELYGAGVESMTLAQGRMIFAVLQSDHGFTNDVDKKAVIAGIIAKLHNGWKLESTKDLSKVWAKDVIDYLQTHSTADLQEFVQDAQPFEG